MKETEKTRDGFTLMELMVVILIVGILAAVAIPMVNKYLKKSKTSEVMVNLRKIYDGEVNYYQTEHAGVSGQMVTKQFVQFAPLPSLPGKDKQNPDWDSANWGVIKFNADGPVLYSYSVATGGSGSTASFTARAQGDIDGDSTTSLFERVGVVDAVTGEISGGGAIYMLDELE